MSGTKPYMAPEVFMCALDEVAGYTYPVDWWSLGVVAYEMRANIRPFSVHSNTALVDVKHILSSPVHYPRYWSPDFVDLLTKLLCVHPGGRISSQQELQQTPLLRHIDFKEVLEKKTKPPFKPPEDHLNCDPCLELEEMIVETRPLHKKKKRLAKQRSAQRDSDPETALVKEFIVYNRFKELKRKDMEKKEREWERELEEAMANSVVTTLAPIMEKPSETLTVSSMPHAENAPNDTMTNTTNNTNRQSSKKSTTMTTLSSSLQMCSNCQRSDSRKSKNAESLEYIDRSPSPNTIGGAT
ncbi:serine/threonine-protein kinase 32B [Musca vetustissima]|uniref:serine/threonine-protein kinase 32B n=1 Tax=Musca vetustissima TaxID=27455 RepID=UPI002AB7654C|nr:serine/threonine-protein kinase 32B [Musca vetustissima]